MESNDVIVEKHELRKLSRTWYGYITFYNKDRSLKVVMRASKWAALGRPDSLWVHVGAVQ